MSMRSAHACKALSSLVRRCAHSDASAIPTLAATAPGGRDGRVAMAEAGRAWRELGATAVTVSALAYLVTDSAEGDDDARGAYCKGEKIVWVDSYGKKVAVHEKVPKTKSEAPTATGVSEPSSMYYPYVIVGYGVAGKAALRGLLERDPASRVLVIDALVDGGPPPSTSQYPKTAKVEFARGVRATALDSDRGILFLSDNTWAGENTGTVPLVVDSSGRPQEEIAFGRCLLALGSRPRPPPKGYVDPRAWMDMALLGWRDKETREGLRRDVQAGKSVTIVGSSWEALELACWLEEGRSLSDKGADGQSRMVFADFAPLDHILPRYLSAALIRRLNRRNIKTLGHSSVRWVGLRRDHSTPRSVPAPVPLADEAKIEVSKVSEQGIVRRTVGAGETAANSGGVERPKTLPPTSETQTLSLSLDPRQTEKISSARETLTRREESSGKPASEENQEPSSARLTPLQQQQLKQQQQQMRRNRRRPLSVSTCHSFDGLETASHSTDRVVLAGLDVAPISSVLQIIGEGEKMGREGTTRGGRGDPAARRGKQALGALEVDARRGAVVVNSELAASSRVWAAGDVACFPSYAHGGRRMVLRTADHAHHSGLVAGHNMAASALDFRDGSLSARGNGGAQRYVHSPAFVGEAPLAGVRVAMVGDCNAALPTHGFWWTNRATGLTRHSAKFMRRTGNGGEIEGSGVTLRSRKTARRDFTPVFGTGVVFYTDGPEVKGAMLWGFPGAAAAAAAAKHRNKRSSAETGRDDDESGTDEESAEEIAAGLSIRAVDLLREIMERSSAIQADLSDERVLAAWIQGLSDAAQIVAQETGLGHLQSFRRSVPGRETSNTRRLPGSRDQLMYEDTSKTVSAESRRNSAFQAASLSGTSWSPSGSALYGFQGRSESREQVELVEFLRGSSEESFDGAEEGEDEEGDGDGSS